MPERSIAEVCAALDTLVQERGFLFSLALMLRHDLFLDPADAADINWRERLSYQEFTFLAGLLVRRPLSFDHPTEDAVREQVERAYALFEELHDAHGARIMERMVQELCRAREEELGEVKSAQAFFGAGDVMTEPIFYSGSGAYDFQYWTMAPLRYRLDRDWLREHTGLDIEIAAEITRAIKNLREPLLDAPPQSFGELLDAVLAMFCISRDDLDSFTASDVEAFLQAFSLEPGAVNETLVEPGQYNRLDSHPLVALNDRLFFIPVYFNLPRSLYESPFYWMIADREYRDTASAHRGETTEVMSADMLRDVSDADVHRNVKLRRGAAVVGEIDALASLGKKGLIVQCKSKRLTELARRGDTERLKNDFRDAVQAAYEQGLACRELLRQDDIRAFVDGETEINATFDDAYIACVVSDHYPSLAHQIHAYLERQPGDPYPIALSIFDLELLCHYLRDAFDFLYYVRQRIDLAEHFRSDEEMSLLAYHLKKKLWASPGADLVALDSSWAQLIDANYPAARGEHPATEASDRLFHEWKNEYYDQLVADLKSSGEPGFVDAVFMLFDFSSDTIDALVPQMLRAKELSVTDGQKHSVATISKESDAGISFVTRADNAQQLEEDTLLYAKLKKYQTRASEWLGLGCLAGSDRLADLVVYNRDPWEHDPILEESTRTLLGSGTAMRLGPKIGRNDPCFCGSGLKYKRCHGR